MQATQNAVTDNEYRNLPVTCLVESANNPRKRFDEKSLEELAASFKAQGILAPLLVRELDESKYEVVAGARRLRAARIAELESVPVRVVQLTDAEATEARVVENLQREDIHPLEEALGFKSLLELGEPYNISHLAARAGKSEAYIYGRIRLADLIPPVAEAFLKDRIAVSHALLLAKLPASQQQEAFNAAFRSMWTSEGNTQTLIPVRELAVWIESNILLQLASAPFDKQDETLIPVAGSCVNCPKRTGFNKLLFGDVVRKDSCTDPNCFRAKIDASVTRTLEAKPQIVQISSAWNTREGAPLGRNRYVELEIKKPKPNGSSAKQSALQRPCTKMREAIVMDGGKRGQVVKVCADPNCRVHHPNTPSPQQIERERAEERRRIEKEKVAITTRHRILAAVLQRVSAPLKKADLLTVAENMIRGLSHSQVPVLAKRHKVEANASASEQELLAKQVSKCDEAGISKLLLEISLLDSAYGRSSASGEPLMDAAKRYRVDTEKIGKAVAEAFALKQKQRKAAAAKKTNPEPTAGTAPASA
jgi:ParB family transcriptional regulator, chromosome partitioning protein